MVRRPAISSINTKNKNDDVHSLTRHPTSSLYMLVKKDREHHAWQLPQGGIDPGETVLQGALRELEEECGQHLKVNPVETTSSFYYQYKFPDAFIAKHKRNYIGAKVQFIRSDWISGQCQPDDHEIVDFAWLLESEIKQYVTPEYFNAITPLLRYPNSSS
ncbi:NUDIX hydrolase domain-like protein [Halteromyces radiatus]|uniref:NUDIX hydrolase domain-like protein n=1 Tax=Halteromyces radiatus TaxID=101107 RepID=UPI00221FCC0A|nr:NUDIX hydrolase domain-like protein [Halteromyces radiatus]KAI8093310.1 NUDIX hydrolase domain-like protein [Halteromyces radiatus]